MSGSGGAIWRRTGRRAWAGSRLARPIRWRAAAFAAVVALMVTACPAPEVAINTTERVIDIDVRNALFNAPDPLSPDTRGLGVTTLTLSVETDPAPTGGAWTATLAPAGLDTTAAANGYTRVSITVEGTLLGVSATAQSDSGTFTGTLTSYPGSTIYQGWTDFANVLKFRLTYGVHETVAQSALSLSVAPKGGGAVTVRADSGVPGTAYNTGLTDRSALLYSGQLAVQVGLEENLTDVTYDVYTAVIDKDIDALYNEDVSFAGTYVNDPWTPAWTYAEIAGQGGKSVGGTVYVLSSLLTGVDAADPGGDGLFSLLIDLPSTDPDLLDKYVLIGITVHAGNLSVPVDVLCLNIE